MKRNEGQRVDFTPPPFVNAIGWESPCQWGGNEQKRRRRVGSTPPPFVDAAEGNTPQ